MFQSSLLGPCIGKCCALKVSPPNSYAETLPLRWQHRKTRLTGGNQGWSALIKEARSSPAPGEMWAHSQDDSLLPRTGISPAPNQAGTLFLDFQPPEQWETSVAEEPPQSLAFFYSSLDGLRQETFYPFNSGEPCRTQTLALKSWWPTAGDKMSGLGLLNLLTWREPSMTRRHPSEDAGSFHWQPPDSRNP